MSEFNLIDEPWISVVTDYKGTTKLVGLKEFFENAQNYIALAGDMPTQDFAVIRFLLAILHTVFSRYDASGKVYDEIEVNDRMQQVANVDDEYEEEYNDALMKTWKDLWNAEKFPEIVVKYLEAWRDRFYLFDDKYPFYQVTENEITPSRINKSSPSEILGKNINRLISESGNKKALFSPKYGSDNNKETLTFDEVARWLITYQSYTGLSDKVIFGKEKYKASKGWLFDIGGVYISSDDLYKILILNLVLLNSSNSDYNRNIQRPCWENLPSNVIAKYMTSNIIDNVSELYTCWSRAIFINGFKPNQIFKMGIVKLPEILHENNFLEPMTVWRYNSSGDNKNTFTPRKHQLNKSLWRSFGLITKTEDDSEGNNMPIRKPGIIEWLNVVDKYIKDQPVKINAISMEDDGNATSWVPVNEVSDGLNIKESILNDLGEQGWIVRINNIIDHSKEIIEKTFRSFLNDIRKIRNVESSDFTVNNIEYMYYEVDKPFRDWLSAIEYNDDKDKLEQAWNDQLKKMVINQAIKIVEDSGPRDFSGITENDSIKNIATAFNSFMSRINKQ